MYMSKKQKWTIGIIASIVILGLAGYNIYVQIARRDVYLDMPIATEQEEFLFYRVPAVKRNDFASGTLRFQGYATSSGGEDEPISTDLYWYIKQGNLVVAEVKADGLTRQNSRGRTGIHTMYIDESFRYSFADEGYLLRGNVYYEKAIWPDWMTPNVVVKIDEMQHDELQMYF